MRSTHTHTHTREFSFYRPRDSKSEWIQNGKMPIKAAVAIFFKPKTAKTKTNNKLFALLLFLTLPLTIFVVFIDHQFIRIKIDRFIAEEEEEK